jgi:signal transduction histidine kinase
MKSTRSLNTSLVLSHLLVSLVSILLMAVYFARFISLAAIAEAEHNLQGLAVASGNALQLPIEDLREGRIETQFIHDMLERMFADNPGMEFSVFRSDGNPLVDSQPELPPRANRQNAPEVIEALESELGRGVNIRENSQGKQTMYMAVLIQREIVVTGILRLGMPMQPTLDGVRQSLMILFGVALLIAIGVSIFGWWLAKNLARPIQGLTQAVEHMELGDLGMRVKPTGPKELQRLSEAFNSMVGRLQSNVNELRAFVANASHELRTPLTVVKLRAEALREGAKEDPEVADRFLSEIETEVDRLVGMVNDLLDLSRVDAGMDATKRTMIDLTAIAHEVYETFSIRSARAGVELALNTTPDLAQIMGNEDQLRRVFYNLVENAIKFTKEGGRVEMSIGQGPKENTVRFTVRDTGGGITPEHLPHVFERFYRADPTQPRPGSSRGSGLGLAIAKSIVENHGGEIGVSSQIGVGATFWADFPNKLS